MSAFLCLVIGLPYYTLIHTVLKVKLHLHFIWETYVYRDVCAFRGTLDRSAAVVALQKQTKY